MLEPNTRNVFVMPSHKRRYQFDKLADTADLQAVEIEAVIRDIAVVRFDRAAEALAVANGHLQGPHVISLVVAAQMRVKSPCPPSHARSVGGDSKYSKSFLQCWIQIPHDMIAQA